LRHLETIPLDNGTTDGPFRMPVQWVNRPHQGFRGYAGTIAAGRAKTRQEIRVLPSGRTSRIARIVTRDCDLPEAVAGQSITVTLADEIDVSRGDVLCAADHPVAVADQFETRVVWMDAAPMLPHRPYVIKLGTRSLQGSLSQPKYKINVNTLEHVAAKTLELNEIGICNLELDHHVPFAPYAESRELGGFIIIDRFTNNTVGMGFIHFALRRSTNVHWQALDVNKRARAAKAGQKPCVLWFTGLSGSGKSTIANLVEKKLHSRGHMTYLLDGDNIRHGLNKDLGFTAADRVENIRRVAEVSKLMADAGLIVLVSFISPYRSERLLARELMDKDEFIEIFIDTPLEICEQRDPKGLYKKARAGEIRNFTGIDSQYERPEAPELAIDTTRLSAAEAAGVISSYLEKYGHLSPPPPA
jgi:bifunctional enzyme CysN/CysC